jgi:hypothetical protein
MANNGKKKGKTKALQLIPNLPAKLGRVYSNFVEISHSPWDFTLRFCDAPPGSDVPRLKLKDGNKVEIPTTIEVIIPVNLMSGLIEALQAQNKTYLETFQKKERHEKNQ